MPPMKRRRFLTTVAAASMTAAQYSVIGSAAQGQAEVVRKGRIKQSLFRNVFGTTKMSRQWPPPAASRSLTGSSGGSCTTA